MKKIIFPFLTILLVAKVLGQEPIKIIFDVTSSDTTIHQTTMRHIKFMASSYPMSEFEVVIYSGSIGMVLNKSSVLDEILQFENNPNVSFKVCANTMKRNKIDKKQLLPGVDIVADGIMEIAEKQASGWAYIKEAN